MLNWLRKKSEEAQRRNVERTLRRLISAANEADERIQRNGGVNPADQRRVVSLQKALLKDMIGPLSLQDLEQDYLAPLLADPEAGEGARLAVEHVFESAKNG